MIPPSKTFTGRSPPGSLERVMSVGSSGCFWRSSIGVLLSAKKKSLSSTPPSSLYPPQYVVPSSPRLARRRIFTLGPISDDSDDSSSSTTSSPRAPCDSEKTIQFVGHDPSKRHDFHHIRQGSHSQSRWSQNQKFIASLASECCPVVVV